MIYEYLGTDGTTKEFLFNVQAKFLNGFEQIRMYGINPDVSTLGTQYIWDGQVEYNYPTSNETLYIVCENNDLNVSVKVHGLIEDNNGDWVRQEILVTTTGTTAKLVGDFIRIYLLEIVDGVVATGDIYLSTTQAVPTSTELRGKIIYDRNRSLMAMYTIPSGYTGFIYRLFESCRKNQDAEFDYQIRPFGNIFKTVGITGIVGASAQLELSYETVPEKSDIRVAVTTETNNTVARASVHLLLVNNEALKGLLK